MRVARHARIRKRVTGTAERPRLAIYKSLKHISAQIIDDSKGVTLASASTYEKNVKGAGNLDGAKLVGELVGKRAKEKGIKSVVFDRGGLQYTGAIANLADSAREAGLEF
ncbi:MAG: 50S ribosomal protein L18 [Fimbriimonadaceae bacterium]|nr:50S ribosomal protein L18 [Fimbriimonadaceae bacterium]